ncbi:MAG: hypothetical protein IJX64_03495, partial [Clostridia bacterium]|nr:hypothetical protein [Clostridia bacterium]
TPLIYYTVDNGAIFSQLSFEIPETRSYEKVTASDIVFDEDAGFAVVWELADGGESRYCRTEFTYCGYMYADIIVFRAETPSAETRDETGDSTDATADGPEKKEGYQYDFTGDRVADRLQITPATRNSAERAAVIDGSSDKTYTIENNSKYVRSVFTAERVEEGWRFEVDGKDSYVMDGAYAQDGKLYSAPRIGAMPYYVTEYSDTYYNSDSFYTAGYDVKRCYDIYLGDDSICGAICETLTYQYGKFVPTAWEYIVSPHSTPVPIQERPKDYAQSFMPEGVDSIRCSGGVLGNSPRLYAYSIGGYKTVTYISFDHGGSYIEFDLVKPQNVLNNADIVDIFHGNSSELSVVFEQFNSDAKKEEYITALYLVDGYMWQWQPYYTEGGADTVEPYSWKEWHHGSSSDATATREWYDLTGDGYDDVITRLPASDESGNTAYIYDAKRQQLHSFPSDTDASTAQSALTSVRTDSGWKFTIGGETVYVVEAAYAEETEFYDTPRVGVNNVYTVEYVSYPDEIAFYRYADIRIGKSSVCGAVCEQYAYRDGKFVPVGWKYTSWPNVWYTKYPWYGYVDFLPEEGTSLICSGCPTGGIPRVLSYATESGEPCVYYTFNNGATFVQLPLDLPETVQYETARVIEIHGGNSLEFFMIVELQNGTETEYCEIAYTYEGYDGNDRVKCDGFVGMVKRDGEYWTYIPDEKVEKEPKKEDFTNCTFAIVESMSDDNTKILWDIELSDGKTLSVEFDKDAYPDLKAEEMLAFSDVNCDGKTDLVINPNAYGSQEMICFLLYDSGYARYHAGDGKKLVQNPNYDRDRTGNKKAVYGKYSKNGTDTRIRVYEYNEAAFFWLK